MKREHQPQQRYGAPEDSPGHRQPCPSSFRAPHLDESDDAEHDRRGARADPQELQPENRVRACRAFQADQADYCHGQDQRARPAGSRGDRYRAGATRREPAR